jgi:hypothetical protein
MSENEKNCWNCGYQQIGGINLFGKCLFFFKLGLKAREIPVRIVDKGCKNWIRSGDETFLKKT